MPAFTFLNKHELRGRQRSPACQDCPSSDENATMMGRLGRSAGYQRAFQESIETRRKQATVDFRLMYNRAPGESRCCRELKGESWP